MKLAESDPLTNHCEEKDCAWWSGQKCVIKEIAYSLTEISAYLKPKLFEKADDEVEDKKGIPGLGRSLPGGVPARPRTPRSTRGRTTHKSRGW